MERYIHRITDADDSETTESKLDHNEALMNNTELHIIHEGIKHELDKEKLKKLQEEYDPSSEFTLESIWNRDGDFDEELEENNDKIVKNLYEDLANLTLEDNREDSSKKKKEDDPVAADKFPPILGGQVSSQSLPSGIARHMKSGSTNKTTSMTTSSSATLSSGSSTITSTPVTSIIP